MAEDIHFRIYPITRVKWLFQIHRDEVVKVNRHEFLFSLNDVVTSLHLEILICPNGAFKGWCLGGFVLLLGGCILTFVQDYCHKMLYCFLGLSVAAGMQNQM